MKFLAIAAGGVLGSFLAGFPGTVLGAVLGGAMGEILSLRDRVAGLEEMVLRMTARAQKTPPDPNREAALQQGAERERARPQPESAEPPAFSSGEIPRETRVENSSREFTWTVEENRRQDRESPPVLPEALRQFLTGGNLVVKVGVIVLFFGVAFLLKYAAQHSLLPMELRLAGVAGGGIALLVTGWKLRGRNPSYALPLQGAGIGVLYMAVFAALRLYGLLPPTLALAILTGIAALSAALAVLQEAPALAVLGAAGGFLAPVLASTGSGSHVHLFSYYALLNGAILGIAWFRAWRILNFVGFVFTFGIGSLWGARYYRPEYFTTVEPFLILFFLTYLAVAILFALRQPPRLKGWLDGTLVFGTPLVAFALQAPLVRDFPYGLAVSALALGGLYFPLAAILFRRGAPLRPLAEAFLALGAIFITLAVPFALDGRWTAGLWALEGAGMVWIGIRQNRQAARVFGLLLQAGAGFFFLTEGWETRGAPPLLNGAWLGAVVIALGGMFSSGILQRKERRIRRWEGNAALVLLVWGLLWWYGAGLSEIDRHLSYWDRPGGALLLFAFSCGLCHGIGTRLDWTRLRAAGLLLLPAMAGVFLYSALTFSHPLLRAGWAGWPAALAVFGWILRKRENSPPLRLKWFHAGGFWLLTALFSWEAAWKIDRWVGGNPTWPLAAWGIAPGLFLLLAVRGGARLEWPLGRHREAYLLPGAAPLAAFIWGWALLANLTSAGNPGPLPYLPLINPLDLALALVFFTLFQWRSALRNFPPEDRRWLPDHLTAWLLGGGLFLWLTAAVARTVHHWGGVPYAGHDLFHSVLLQASLSLTWSFTALGVMFAAGRRGNRPLWLVGASILSGVVVKLFLIDLDGTGTVARIVSFIGVGLLLLVIGYLSPAPPRSNAKESP